MRAVGIDLGTTNSVLAESEIENGEIITKIIEIERLDIRPGHRGYTQKRDRLLPSVAYYNASENSWIVGDGAQKKSQEEPASVAKSVKRHMDFGKKNFSLIPRISWTPIQISTEILKQLFKGAKYMWMHIDQPDPCVITVPASFQSSMIQATIEAAKTAGSTADIAGLTEITESDLFFEPHAALLQFFNTNHINEITFSETDEQFFLVFDLGGGTLDVSLHKISKENNSLTIEDIAISPYNRFGGDDFDKKVAQSLLKKYPPYITLKSPDKELVEFQFQEYAKDAKEFLTPYTKTHPIKKTPKDSAGRSLYPFAHNLSPSEYKDIVNLLLAPSLDLQSCHSKDPNIINPILDVLDSGRKKLGRCDRPNVDIVLLNGGMTKLNIIRERLTDFFKGGYVIPEGEFDPETAVAQGASIYCLHKTVGTRSPLSIKFKKKSNEA